MALLLSRTTTSTTRHGRRATGRGGRTATSTSTSYGTTSEPVAADRLLLFSDAVFAISETLLVLDIRVPAGLGPAQFSQTLREQLPAIAAYALSFAVIGQLWLFHHRIFAFVACVDTHILVRGLLLLGLVAFMPFPSGC